MLMLMLDKKWQLFQATLNFVYRIHPQTSFLVLEMNITERHSYNDDCSFDWIRYLDSSAYLKSLETVSMNGN